MIIDKNDVRKSKGMKAAQRADKKENRDKKLERGSALKRNIEKVVSLTSEECLTPVSESSNPASTLSAGELISKIEAAGLTGRSGSGFPTAEKLKTFLASEATGKTIIINGAECEPGLLNDAWLMRNKGQQIIDGAAALKAAFNPERIILASRGKPEYLQGLDTKGLELMRLPLKYPLGEEHFLIAQVLGISLAPDAIPAQRGIMVINVQTVYQIARILNGSYDGGHFVTLANLKTGEARIDYVHDDTPVEAALKNAFGSIDGTVFSGGGIGRAFEAEPGEAFCETTAFAAISNKVTISNGNKCKKCGGCTRKCPMDIRVKDIVIARQKDPEADTSRWNPEKCVHCGTCTFFCPAGKDPALYVAM